MLTFFSKCTGRNEHLIVGVADRCRRLCCEVVDAQVKGQTITLFIRPMFAYDMFSRQEGLGQIASKFGTSPEELLKEEKTWANGVSQVCVNFASLRLACDDRTPTERLFNSLSSV